MRTFYVFLMKKEFRVLYQGRESALYEILKRLYYLDKDEVNYGFHLFCQLTEKIEKEKLDNYLFIKMHQDIPYSKRGNKHRINNLYKDEISILEVKHSYIKITAEQEGSSFFEVLSSVDSDFFVCDFDAQDYFFVDHFKNACIKI